MGSSARETIGTVEGEGGTKIKVEIFCDDTDPRPASDPDNWFIEIRSDGEGGHGAILTSDQSADLAPVLDKARHRVLDETLQQHGQWTSPGNMSGTGSTSQNNAGTGAAGPDASGRTRLELGYGMWLLQENDTYPSLIIVSSAGKDAGGPAHERYLARLEEARSKAADLGSNGEPLPVKVDDGNGNLADPG